MSEATDLGMALVEHAATAGQPTVIEGYRTGVIAACSREIGAYVTGISSDPVLVRRWSTGFAAEFDAVVGVSNTVGGDGLVSKQILLLFVAGQPIALCTYETIGRLPYVLH